jgi:very-short-patch-repair endonuclease
VTARQAGRIGVHSDELGRLVRGGELVRLRQGAFVDGDAWRQAHPSDRLLLRARAVVADRPGAALTRQAALAAHDVALYDVDYERVDLVQQVKRSYRRSGVVTWPAPDGHEVVESPSGLPTVPLALAVVQVAMVEGLVAGVVAADDALHAGLVRRADLEALVPPDGAPGCRRVRELVARADRWCESPGESRTRLLLHGLGFEFRSQVGIRRAGRVLARVDFLVEGRVVVEFDGAVKYAGAQGQAALVAEKAREDELRACGFEVVRLTWRDLDDPALVARLIRAAIARVPRH